MMIARSALVFLHGGGGSGDGAVIYAHLATDAGGWCLAIPLQGRIFHTIR